MVWRPRHGAARPWRQRIRAKWSRGPPMVDFAEVSYLFTNLPCGAHHFHAARYPALAAKTSLILGEWRKIGIHQCVVATSMNALRPGI